MQLRRRQCIGSCNDDTLFVYNLANGLAIEVWYMEALVVGHKGPSVSVYCH